MKRFFKRIINACNIANPFFEFLVAIATIISVILVGWTLKEMQIQRNNSYNSVIVFEPKDITVTTNSFNVNTIDNYGGENLQFITLPAYNVGVGAAHSIKITIDYEPIIYTLQQLQSVDTQTEYNWGGASAGEWSKLYIYFDKFEGSIEKQVGISSDFLLPNAENSINLNLSPMLTLLYGKLGEYREKMPNELDLPMTIEYIDVQGRMHIEKASLYAALIGIHEDNTGINDTYIFSLQVKRTDVTP
jgi:hypothetical protein